MPTYTRIVDIYNNGASNPSNLGTNQGSERQSDLDAASIATAPVVPLSMRATLCAKLAAQLRIEQRSEIAIAHEHHVTPVSTISAVGTAAWHELLASEAHAAVSASARGDRDAGLIDEQFGGLHVYLARLGVGRARA